MAQIRKGFIAANAIDGTKLKLLNNEAIRAANADGSDAELMKLDGSNVLQFLKMPQVSADPSAGNDVARKSYVDNSISSAQSSLAADLASETAARQAADSAEESARQSADSALQSDINTEISDREAAVAAEASAREAADLAESSARTAADSAEQSAREAADSAEALARETADNALSARLDVVEGVGEGSVAKAESDAKAYADQKIADLVNSAPAVLDTLKELADALGDDPNFATTVAGQIGDEATARAAADATEAAARQAADSAEQSAREAADLALQSDISDEASARSSADQTLQSNIDAEAAARQSADSTETAARIADVADLQSQIDALDSGSSAGLSTEIARAQAAEAALQAEIDAEETARANAVSAEATARDNADNALQATIDALDVNDLGSVNISSAQDGDIWQYDLDSGKWVNVAPMAAASSTTIPGQVIPGTETLYLSQSAAGIDGTASASADTGHFWAGYGRGIRFAGNGEKLSRVLIKMRKESGHANGGTVYLKLTTQFGGSSVANSALVQVSTVSSSGDYVEFDFSSANFTTGNGTTYYAELVLSGPDTFLAAAWGGAVSTISGFWYAYANPASYEVGTWAWDAKVYTGSAGSVGPDVTVVNTGVIKTNTDGKLDDSFLEYDVNFGGHKLQGVSTPTSGTDAANKSYVDGEVSSEASARSAADATLQSNIDAEASARQSAVSSEASARQAADNTLQSNIDAEASARASAVSAEQSAREAADSNLQSQIDALDSGSSAGLAQEVADRQAADADLQDQIDTEKGRIDAILSASDADKDSFAEIVALINSVDTENDSAFASYVLSNDAALAQEVSDRQAAVSAEESARQSADTMLQSNIDGEASTRQAADDALDTRVDALEAITHQKAKFTLTSMDIMNGYVELSHTAVTDSELVFVGSLYLHSGDHYSTSAGMSGTRLTWMGDVASGGSSELLEGDTVYVRYQASTGNGGGGGGGGGGGAPSYSFPMIIGVTDNGDGTTNLNWMGANLPNAGADMVYLVPVVGPAMYDDANKVVIGGGMSLQGNVTTPAAGTYVLRVYDGTGIIPQVTSASFSI